MRSVKQQGSTPFVVYFLVGNELKHPHSTNSLGKQALERAGIDYIDPHHLSPESGPRRSVPSAPPLYREGQCSGREMCLRSGERLSRSTTPCRFQLTARGRRWDHPPSPLTPVLATNQRGERTAVKQLCHGGVRKGPASSHRGTEEVLVIAVFSGKLTRFLPGASMWVTARNAWRQSESTTES